MRRITFVLVPALVAGLLAVSAPAASADSTLVSKVGLPAGWTMTSVRLDGKPGDSTYSHVEGPTGVPTGLGSLRLEHRLHSFKQDLRLDLVPDEQAARWSTFEVTYRSDVDVRVDLGFYSPTLEQQAIVYLPPTTAWTTVDLLAADIRLVGDPHEQDYGGTTWAQLNADHPGAKVVALDLQTRAVGSTWIDTIRYGATGDVTTVDFDTDPIPVITSSTATVLLPAGASTPLSGRVARPSGTPIADLAVALWVKVWGTGTWVKAATALTEPDGAFRTRYTPTRQTYVQWRVADPSFAPATSATRRIDVRAQVWAKPSDTTLIRPQRVRVFGKVAPSLAGRTVTLRRAGYATPLATATVRADSTYGVSAPLPRGTWSVYVTSPAGGGILAGKSTSIRVFVA